MNTTFKRELHEKVREYNTSSYHSRALIVLIKIIRKKVLKCKVGYHLQSTRRASLSKLKPTNRTFFKAIITFFCLCANVNKSARVSWSE